MATRETLRDYITGDLDSDLVRQRQSAGWRMMAVEWEREVPSGQPNGKLEVPYGMRVSRDCHHLEEDPEEAVILRTVMRMVVQDKPLSKISDELNNSGYRTRTGSLWTISAVFKLMPVLVDSGPRMFADPAWAVTRSS